MTYQATWFTHFEPGPPVESLNSLSLEKFMKIPEFNA